MPLSCSRSSTFRSESGKPDVHHHGKTDDFGRCLEVAKGTDLGHPARVGRPSCQINAFPLTMPFWQQGPLLANDASFIPSLALRGDCGKLNSRHDLPSDPPSKPNHQQRAGGRIISSFAMEVLRSLLTATALRAHSAALSPNSPILRPVRISTFGRTTKSEDKCFAVTSRLFDAQFGEHCFGSIHQAARSTHEHFTRVQLCDGLNVFNPNASFF